MAPPRFTGGTDTHTWRFGVVVLGGGQTPLSLLGWTAGGAQVRTDIQPDIVLQLIPGTPLDACAPPHLPGRRAVTDWLKKSSFGPDLRPSTSEDGRAGRGDGCLILPSLGALCPSGEEQRAATPRRRSWWSTTVPHRNGPHRGRRDSAGGRAWRTLYDIRVHAAA